MYHSYAPPFASILTMELHHRLKTFGIMSLFIGSNYYFGVSIAAMLAMLFSLERGRRGRGGKGKNNEDHIVA